MKKIFWIITMIAVSCTSSYAQQDPYNDNNNTDDVYYDNTQDQQQDDGMSYQTFYDQLSPYGSWVNYPDYGYVWVPQVDADFAPYQTAGNWQYTDAGWTWVSDYPWGWATFHYGRWFYDPAYGGWLWMPGYDWAPAWVNWGNYGDYYCWTPIGPRDFVNGRWGYGAYDHHWNCLPRGRMGDAAMGRYIVSNEVVNHDRADFERRVTIVNHTNTYGRSVYNAGPRVEEVQKVVGHDIPRMSFNNSAKPGKTEVHGNAINVYRPVISRTTTQHAVPSKVVNPSEVHSGGGNQRNNGGANENQNHNEPGNNSNPGRNQQPHTTTTPERPSPQGYEPNRQTSPPRQSVPTQTQHSGGGFIPSERPSYTPARSAPAPSFHAPSGGGGGGFHGGGGRH